MNTLFNQTSKQKNSLVIITLQFWHSLFLFSTVNSTLLLRDTFLSVDSDMKGLSGLSL